MLPAMTPKLQKHHENVEETQWGLFNYNLAKGNSVGPHVLQMIWYIENLDKLLFPLGQDLAIDLLLQSLLNSYC